MTSLIKNKMTATALAVCTVLGMGYSAMASAAVTGNTATEFTTTISITSDNTCKLAVEKPASAAFAATWTKTAGKDESTLTVDSAKDPIFIKVAVDNSSSANCKLNGINIGTQVTNATAAASTGDESVAWLQDFGSAGGKWRFAPSLAQVKLYTDSDFTTADTGTVTVTDAAGKPAVQQAGKKVNGGDSVTIASIPAMGKQEAAYTLTDSYFNVNDGFVPMAKEGGPAVTFSTNSGAAIKSAEIGVGGIIGGDPEDANGDVDRMAAANGDSASLIWVTTISEA